MIGLQQCAKPCDQPEGLRGAWRDHRFPEPFSWFLHETSLEVWRSPLHAVFYWNVKGKSRKKRKSTASFVASLGAGVRPRSTVQLFMPVSGVENRHFRSFFLSFGVSFGEEKPFVTSNVSFYQETRVWAAKTNQTVRWLLSACVPIRFCPEAPASSTVDVNSWFSRFQFSALWSNGLASSVFIFAPILLRFFLLSSSMQGLQYVVTDFLISTCEKSYVSSKPTR